MVVQFKWPIYFYTIINKIIDYSVEIWSNLGYNTRVSILFVHRSGEGIPSVL